MARRLEMAWSRPSMSVWATAALGVIGAAGPLRLPEPAAPPVEVIEERGPSPMYYRKRNDIVSMGSRIGLGAAVSVASARELARGRFVLDVMPVLELGLHRGSKAGFLVEGGYSYALRREHYFVLGAGPMWRRFGPSVFRSRRHESGSMAAALVPHGLVGTVDGELAGGVRTSLLFHFFLIGVEVAHQYVATSVGGQHDVRIMANLGMVGGSL